jgi:hypothetical protein
MNRKFSSGDRGTGNYDFVAVTEGGYNDENVLIGCKKVVEAFDMVGRILGEDNDLEENHDANGGNDLEENNNDLEEHTGNGNSNTSSKIEKLQARITELEGRIGELEKAMGMQEGDDEGNDGTVGQRPRRVRELAKFHEAFEFE